jgi:hypothetical protein
MGSVAILGSSFQVDHPIIVWSAAREAVVFLLELVEDAAGNWLAWHCCTI